MLFPDIWEKFCYFLKYEDICNVSLTCKMLNSVANRPTIYKRKVGGVLRKNYNLKKVNHLIKKTTTYKEAYKDLYFRGAYATHFTGGIPLISSIVAGVECINMAYKKSYLVFTKREICKLSIPRFMFNYITNFKEGAIVKICPSLYLARDLRETKKSPAVSIGILDHKDFTSYIFQSRSIFEKVRCLLFSGTCVPMFFPAKNIISLNDPVCKQKFMFENVETIKSEVLENITISIYLNEIIEINSSVHGRVYEINSIPIGDFLKLHELC